MPLGQQLPQSAAPAARLRAARRLDRGPTRAVCVRLPVDVCQALTRQAADAGYDSLTAYAASRLKQLAGPV